MHDVKTRWFQDENEPETMISEAQLKKEYGISVADGSIDPAEKTFQDYLRRCMRSQGGTLTEVFPEKENRAKYPFLIRETLAMRVEVEAGAFTARANSILIATALQAQPFFPVVRAANPTLVMTMICGKWMKALQKHACFATVASPTWRIPAR